MSTFTPTSLERRADGMGSLSARLPDDLAAKFKEALDARGVTATEAAREAVAMWIDGRPAVSTTSQARTDGDRLRAAMVKAGVDAAKLARLLGYAHRSAVADVLRAKGPRPLQGPLLAWVEDVEARMGARR